MDNDRRSKFVAVRARLREFLGEEKSRVRAGELGSWEKLSTAGGNNLCKKGRGGKSGCQ